jgi:membrane-associated phospholipid phosphatase
MFLGLHYPSDVIVGGLLGTMTALGVCYFSWL